MDIGGSALIEAERGVERARATRGWCGAMVEGAELRLAGVLAAAGFLLTIPIRVATQAEEMLAEELLVAKAELRAAECNLSKALDALAMAEARNRGRGVVMEFRRPFSSHVWGRRLCVRVDLPARGWRVSLPLASPAAGRACLSGDRWVQIVGARRRFVEYKGTVLGEFASPPADAARYRRPTRCTTYRGDQRSTGAVQSRLRRGHIRRTPPSSGVAKQVSD
jgi:hypothetical protein